MSITGHRSKTRASHVRAAWHAKTGHVQHDTHFLVTITSCYMYIMFLDETRNNRKHKYLVRFNLTQERAYVLNTCT